MSGVQAFDVETKRPFEMVDVTPLLRRYLAGNGCRDGLLLAYVPHTTAAVTINENADPDVTSDIQEFLRRLVPACDWFRHGEGNSHAHILSSLVGASETLMVANGELLLGTWQGVYFCEFDGPRRRRLLLKFLAAPPTK